MDAGAGAGTAMAGARMERPLRAERTAGLNILKVMRFLQDQDSDEIEILK